MGHEAGKRKKQKDEDKFQSFFSLDSRETRERVDVGGKVDEGSASESSGNDDDEKDIQSYGPGWRVEFRPLEIQLTDFENAAFSLLTVLTTRCMLAMGYNFYLPISLVEENMRRAQLQNAVIEQTFWVRKESFLRPPMDNIPTPAPGGVGVGTGVGVGVVDGDKDLSCITYGDVESGRSLVPAMSEITPIEMSLHEFFTGNQTTGFLGLIPAIYGYLTALGCDASTIDKLQPYLTLLQNRASGEGNRSILINLNLTLIYSTSFLKYEIATLKILNTLISLTNIYYLHQPLQQTSRRVANRRTMDANLCPQSSWIHWQRHRDPGGRERFVNTL